jgi:hypothetical protein
MSLLCHFINPFRRSHISAVVRGMMVIPEDVAINGRASKSSWGHSRLSPVNETAAALRFAIRFLSAQHPIGRFGQVPRHCPDRLRMPFAPGDAVVEVADVAVGRPPAAETNDVRGFHERSLEIAIDVGPRRAEAGLPSARVNTWRGACIGS